MDINFGYDSTQKSVYKNEFWFPQEYRTGGKASPPAPSVIWKIRQIVPQKSISLTSQDFTEMGNDSRRRAYENSRSGFRAAKEYQMKTTGELLQYNKPLTTEPKTRAPPHPEYMFIRRNTPNETVGNIYNNYQIKSLTSSTFQWPDSEKIALPQFRSRE